MHSLLPPVGFGVLIIYLFKLIERKSSVVVLHETREIITLTVELGNRWISLSYYYNRHRTRVHCTHILQPVANALVHFNVF